MIFTSYSYHISSIWKKVLLYDILRSLTRIVVLSDDNIIYHLPACLQSRWYVNKHTKGQPEGQQITWQSRLLTSCTFPSSRLTSTPFSFHLLCSWSQVLRRRSMIAVDIRYKLYPFLNNLSIQIRGFSKIDSFNFILFF